MRRFELLGLLLAPVWAPAQDTPPAYLLITNATVWDGTSNTVTPGLDVLVENNLIKEISADPIVVNRHVSGIFIAGLVLDRINWLSQDAASEGQVGGLSPFE